MRARPGASAGRSGLRAAWAGLTTRSRLILVVLAIDLMAALVCGVVVVMNARTAVKVETGAARATVEPLVADTLRMARAASPESLLHTLDLRFRALRHVRVAVLDAQGRRIGPDPSDPRPETGGTARASRRAAPDWFAALIRPKVQQHDLPIVVEGARVGTAIVTTEPRDEIDEVWSYVRALGAMGMVVNLAVLVALYAALGRLLRPLDRLMTGLSQLERHDYAVRLDPPVARDLAPIARRFNSLAEALDETRAANGRLNRQLLTAQDDEGRRIALELHDEFGPCLFALEANAASIARIADGPLPPDRAKLADRAGAIAGIVGQVQARNRELLNRLRPHGLGQVPLGECLDLLLRDFARRHPGTTFEGRFEGLARGYGPLVDLTVFRCVQESTTNAVRHGGAGHVRAEVGPGGRGDGLLRVSVRDDGTGFAPGHRDGLGLSGMRERVEALGGSLALDKTGPGAVVRIVIPVEALTREPVREDGHADALGSPARTTAPQPLDFRAVAVSEQTP